MPWDAVRYAPGCTGCGLCARVRCSRTPPWLTRPRWWLKTTYWDSQPSLPRARCGSAISRTYRWALVLPGHVARCLLPPGRGLAPGGPDAHRTRVTGPGVGPDDTPTRAGRNYSRRPRQSIPQCRLPGPHRPSRHPGQLQPAGQSVRQRAQAEPSWITLKIELLPGSSSFASLAEARLEVTYYLDTYFNLAHRHSILGYWSPHQPEQDLKTNLP